MSTSTTTTSTSSTCAKCDKTQAQLQDHLKKCAQCKSVLYCSRDCQVAAWPEHKAACLAIRGPRAAGAGATTSSAANPPGADLLAEVLQGLGIKDNNKTYNEMLAEMAGDTPPSNLNKAGQDLYASTGSSNAYLSSLPEDEAIRQFIDAFRLRCEDEYTHNGDTFGLYNGSDPLPEFRRFLDKAVSRKVLPDGWTKKKRANMVEAAQDRKGGSCIHFAVEKHDIVEAYGNPMMPMQLRHLAETIYGTPIMRFY